MQFYKISSEQRVDLPLHQSFLSFWAKLFIMHMVGHMIGYLSYFGEQGKQEQYQLYVIWKFIIRGKRERSPPLSKITRSSYPHLG